MFQLTIFASLVSHKILSSLWKLYMEIDQCMRCLLIFSREMSLARLLASGKLAVLKWVKTDPKTIFVSSFHIISKYL